MITARQIDSTIYWVGLRQFGHFVLSHCAGSELPDYKKMNLMQIPQLVPYIWTFDLRTYPDTGEIRINFAGEKHTELHGRNIMGDTLEGVVGHFDHYEKVDAMYRKSVADKQAAYSRRFEKHTDEHGGVKWKYAEALHFPCSSDGETVNWGIGCACYNTATSAGEHSIPDDGKTLFLHF